MLTISKKNELLVVLMLVLQFIIVILPQSTSADIISFVLYFALMFKIFISTPHALLKYLQFVVLSSWAIISLWPLEYGNINMSGYYSKNVGSIPTYVLGWMVFYVITYCLEYRRLKNASRLMKERYVLTDINNDETSFIHKRIGKTNLTTIISLVSIALVSICFLSVARSPSFVLGVSRFEYSLPRIVSISTPFLYALIPVVCLSWKDYKILPILFLSIFVLLEIWIGEKFSGLLRLLYFVCIAVMIGSFNDKNAMTIIRRIFIVAFILIMLMMILVYYVQSGLVSDFGEYIEVRLAAQGELWWRTYSDDSQSGLHLNEITDEVYQLFYQPDANMANNNFGIYKLMKKFMSPTWVAMMFSNGMRATEATRATFFYYGKTIGLVIGQAVLAFIVNYIINLIIESAKKNKWALTFAATYLFRLFISVSFMSDFYVLTQRRTIIFMLIMIILSRRRFILRRGKHQSFSQRII